MTISSKLFIVQLVNWYDVPIIYIYRRLVHGQNPINYEGNWKPIIYTKKIKIKPSYQV